MDHNDIRILLRLAVKTVLPLLIVLVLAIKQSWQFALGVGGVFGLLALVVYGGRKLKDRQLASAMDEALEADIDD